MMQLSEKQQHELEASMKAYEQNSFPLTLELYLARVQTSALLEKEKIENEKEIKVKMEELFKKRTGMTIDMLVGKIQTAIIENSSLLDILKKN